MECSSQESKGGVFEDEVSNDRGNGLGPWGHQVYILIYVYT